MCNVLLHQRDEVVVKELIGGVLPSCLPWTVIEVVHGRLYLLPRDLAEVRAFRKKTGTGDRWYSH